MYLTTINRKKRGYGFEGQKGEVDGRVWREETEGAIM